MPGVKFVVSAEVAPAVQELLRVRAAEQKTTEGLKQMVAESNLFGKVMSANARQAARELEGTARAANRAVPSMRGAMAGGLYTSQPSSGIVPRTEAELFARWARAQETRNANRLQDVNFENSYGKGAGLQWSIGEAIKKAQAGRDQLQDAAAAAFEKDMRERELETTMALNRFSARQEGKEKFRGALQSNLAMAAAGVAAISAEFPNEVRERVDTINQSGSDFEREMRPLLAMGGNIRSASDIRDKVLAASGAYGISTGEVAGGMSIAQRIGGNKQQQQELLFSGLKLNEVTGADITTTITTAAKVMNVFGDASGNAMHVVNLLANSEERAGFGAEEMSNMLLRSSISAKYTHTSLEETIAILDVASSVFGRNREEVGLFTSGIEKLDNAMQRGALPRENIVASLERISKMGPAAREALRHFVDDGEIAKLSGVGALSEKIHRELDGISHLPDNLLDRKIASSWADKPSAEGRISGLIATALEDDDKFWGSRGDPRFTNYNVAKQGSRIAHGPLAPEFVWKTSAWIESLVGNGKTSSMGLALAGGGKMLPGLKNLDIGLMDMVQKAEKAGNRDEADYLKVRGGSLYGLNYLNGKGDRKFTDQNDASLFMKLRSEGFDLTPKDMATFMGLNERWGGKGQMGGALFLARHDQKEWDELAGKGFNVDDPRNFIKFKNGFKNEEEAWNFLGTLATGKDAADYAHQKAAEAHEEAADKHADSAEALGAVINQFGSVVSRLDAVVGKMESTKASAPKRPAGAKLQGE